VVPVLGPQTLPPTELARKFAVERHLPERQLELVMFLDGHAKGAAAVELGEGDFAETIRRPGMTWFSALE